MKHFYFFLFTFFAFNLSFGQEVTELYFSKYAEGSSNNKFVEIYNGTDQTIDLSGYAYPTVSNAPTTTGVHEYWNDFEPGAEILPGDVYIIAHPSANAAILQEADETYTYMSNGDDGMALAFGTEDNYVVLDWIGDFNGDPGSGWEVAGVSNATKDKTLIRKSTVCGPNDDWADAAGTSAEDSEWIVQPQDTWDGLGSYTGCVSNPDPTLTITSPSNGTEFIAGTTSVTLSLSVLDFTVGAIDSGADGHIHWSVNGENQMKYDTGDEIITVEDGETYNIYVELVDNNHNPITPATNQSVTFSVKLPDPSLPISDDFDYPDGDLISSTVNWSDIGGTGVINVNNGKAIINHLVYKAASTAFTSSEGSIYYAFDFIVNDPGSPISGNDYEYFAIFKNNSYDYRARLDIVEANTAGNDFSVGISTKSSTADVIWGSDLTFGTSYRATVKYNQISNIAQLWINANEETDTSVTGTDEDDPGTTITQFAFRQSNTSSNETISIDNLVVAQSFIATLSLSNDRNQNVFILFPNPTNTGFVTIKSNQMGAVQAQVFDLLGKEVVNTVVNNERLDVSNLNAGVYVVKLTQNKNTTTKKLIIQ